MHAKFPETTWPIWLNIVFIALVLIGLCRLSRWCYWLAVPVALISIHSGWSTLAHNAGFREAMIQHLGYGYYVQYACSFAVPAIALAVCAFFDFRHRRGRSAAARHP